jgi:hypothetical protein
MGVFAIRTNDGSDVPPNVTTYANKAQRTLGSVSWMPGRAHVKVIAFDPHSIQSLKPWPCVYFTSFRDEKGLGGRERT